MFNMKWLAVLALVFVLAAAAYGFAAANTVATSGAGEGPGDISGYNITNVKYTVTKGDGATDSTSATVSFNASPLVGGAPDADHAAVKFDNGTMTDCVLAGSLWTCTLPGGTKVKDIAKLTVLAWDEN